MSRGIRNNNPGNIDHNPANKWQGQLPHDEKIEKRFCRFESPEYGIRALFKLLRNYQLRHQLHSIRKIINRYAPPVENNTESYIQFAAEKVGVSADEKISTQDKKVLFALAEGIIKMENSNLQPYSDDIFTRAFELL
ncbi:structural protein [Xenorhabdus budapestensis]|uniref:Structural protein n=1 Tax=Xenorhabdus budapestensis TaxID=290110 RepID=A0ABX7VMI5_XENBU|nr:structural protein [Xenorhabdus budapestensis]QTL40932.1 structural protein [Xenorhabdus budapestensis]